MIFKSAHGLVRWARRYLVLVALFLAALRLWTAGFWAEHHVSLREFSVARLSSSAAVPAHFAPKFCAQHGWKPFRPSAQHPRKVYDLVLVNTELDWLEIRLNTTYDYVDYFVLVEAPLTFTGQPKPLAIKGSGDLLVPYRDKLIYHELQYPPGFQAARPWDREDLQRDATLTQVFPRLAGGAQAPRAGDVLVVADVDEIPRPETLVVLRTCAFPRRLTLRSRFYYYSFQHAHRGPQWPHPQATTFEGLAGTIRPVNLRNGDGAPAPWLYWQRGDLWNAAWHCSSCYETVEGFLRKLSSFSHVWMNQDAFRNRDRIADAVREGRDLWGREGEFFDRVENNTDVPPYLLKYPERYRYLLNRDGESAGFIDYP